MAAERGMSGVTRRDALRTMGASVVGAASALWVNDLIVLAQQQAAHAHLLAVTQQGVGAWTPAVLSSPQLQTVGTLVELIIPTTGTPGAKAALVDRFVDSVLTTASPAVRDRFLTGLDWLDRRSTMLFNVPFDRASAEQQTDLLTRLSREPSTEDAAGVQFFTAIKSMTITGYYTSEIGLRQELGDDGVLVSRSFPGCTHPEHQV